MYDEFGAIFLLILVTKARLGLSDSELGIRKKGGFLSEYLKHENYEQSLDDLSEEQKSHLGNWINALYLAEGLSDELFTNCSPHDFYLLIPTLFRQSVIAYHLGKLTHDSLKAGLDCRYGVLLQERLLIQSRPSGTVLATFSHLRPELGGRNLPE